MIRVARITLALALVGAALPTQAGAQTPLPPAGRLAPPELLEPPASVPRGPIGRHPEDWADLVPGRQENGAGSRAFGMRTTGGP